MQISEYFFAKGIHIDAEDVRERAIVIYNEKGKERPRALYPDVENKNPTNQKHKRVVYNFLFNRITATIRNKNPYTVSRNKTVKTVDYSDYSTGAPDNR